MKRILILAATIWVLSSPAALAGANDVVLYKNPQCGCCEGYADYLRSNGFSVIVKPSTNMSLIKRQNGVPAKFEGCHTSLVDGYVVEGHVPVGALNKLLSERPDITGISLPGMPMGSPGMSGRKTAPFEIFQFTADGKSKPYTVE